MKNKTNTTLHVAEGLFGYEAIKYLPRVKLLGKFTGVAVATGVIAFGVFAPSKMGSNHVLAVGLGAGVNEIFNLVGFK